MKRAIISLTSDFGVQSQGVGIMEGVILDIAPDAHVIHLMHGLPDYDMRCAARTMETVKCLPVGYHVCVVDPSAGSKRAIIIKTKRGDYLIGPDNGVLISAANILGGPEKIVEFTNTKYMRQPVSPIFHGRDIFCPAAAHLSNGIDIKKFGKELKSDGLFEAPYDEATIEGGRIKAEVIHINKYGSVNINVLQPLWDKLSVKKGEKVTLDIYGKKIGLVFVDTFAEVDAGKPAILKDNYGRMEIAVNLGNFSKLYTVNIGDLCTIEKGGTR